VHANLIDGVSAQPLHNATIIARNGRIESVSINPAESPTQIQRIDLRGGWLLPGLVDAHAHLYDLRGARIALASGVTMIRAMGGSRFADVGIRELHRIGVTDVPDVVAAGYQIRPRLNDDFPLDFPQLYDLMSEVRGAESMRRLVRAMTTRRVDLIKILATERAGLADQDPFKRTFTDEELAAAVDESRRALLPIAAHAHAEEGAEAAVRAGVNSIEHGTYLNGETLDLMKRQGTFFVPTIMFSKGLTEEKDPKLHDRGETFLHQVRNAVAHAWKLGVKIAAGTDAEYGRDSRSMPKEIAQLVEAGIPIMNAIKAATSVAAECIGAGNRAGRVVPGLDASFVALDQDPLQEVAALQSPTLVVNRGKVIINRLRN
jgi:imidazolonepropionase-like amidohydrolase